MVLVCFGGALLRLLVVSLLAGADSLHPPAAHLINQRQFKTLFCRLDVVRTKPE